MKLITEAQIDKAFAELEGSEEAYLHCLEDLQARHSILFAYLLSEDFEALTISERDYLFFLLAVIWNALRKELPPRTSLTEQELGQAEERNWALLEETPSHRFRERLDVFFTDYPQEDLLAFLEDALADEEEDILTKEGREPIFVTLKSILDCWIRYPL